MAHIGIIRHNKDLGNSGGSIPSRNGTDHKESGDFPGKGTVDDPIMERGQGRLNLRVDLNQRPQHYEESNKVKVSINHQLISFNSHIDAYVST